MQNTAIINEILFEDGYSSSEDVLKDWLVMIALSRIDQFRAEKESFESDATPTIHQIPPAPQCSRGVKPILLLSSLEN